MVSLYIFSLFLTYYFVSFSIKNNLDKEIFNKSHISAVTLDNFFTNIFNIIQDKGKKIANSNSTLKNTDINNILSREFNYNILNTNIPVYTFWPKFFWINIEGKVLVTSYDGILKRRKDLLFENHHFLSKTNNWEMFFSEPKKDKYGKDIIDLSMGVSNDNGEYLGIIMTRLEINKLFDLINNIIKKDNFEYILYHNKKTLFSSNNHSYLFENNNIKKFLQKDAGSIINNGVTIGNNYFNKINKLDNFPIYLFSGYNNKNLNLIIFKNFILYVIIISIIFCLILWIYYLSKKTVNLRKKRFKSVIKTDKSLNKKLNKNLTQLSKSKKIHDKFLIDLMLRSNEQISIIKHNIETLLKIDIDKNHLDSNYKFDIYNNILINLNKIKFLLPIDVKKTKVDIIKVINNAINHHYDLKIKFNIDVVLFDKSYIKFIEGDELGLLQIISSLIYSAYMNRPSSKIHINLSNIRIKDEEYINIIIVDDGIGLNEDDKKCFKVDNFHRYNFSNIKELISQYHGKINFKNNYNVGTEVNITIPVKVENKEVKNNNQTKSLQEEKSNIIQFPIND